MKTFRVWRTYKAEGHDYCSIEAETAEEALKIVEIDADIDQSIDWHEGETEATDYEYKAELLDA